MTSSLKINTKCGALLSIAMLLASNTQAFAADAAAGSFAFIPSLASTKGAAISTAKWSALAFAAISAFRIATKWGDRNEPRYDFDKIMAGEDLGQQAYYLWEDGLVGHTGIKPYLQLNPENGRTEHLNWCWPKGFLGWSHYYHKGIIKGVGTAAGLFILYQVLNHPEITKDNFFEILGKVCKNLADKFPFTSLNPTDIVIKGAK